MTEVTQFASSRPSPIGQRVVVVGTSCAGKSTLAEQLASLRGLEMIELDALHWKPGWTPSADDEWRPKLEAAITAPRWVIAGNYSRVAMPTAWPHADTVIWLDFPLHLTLRRIVLRSWKRSRSGELLWNTNRENFYGQFRLWSEDSLITYTVKNKRRMDRRFVDAMTDPRWAHIRFVRRRSRAEVAGLLQRVASDAPSA